MKGYVANTDFDWYRHLLDLSREGPLEEVNFWQPSGNRAFRALSPGDLFFFKLKNPHYAVAGFGTLARASVLPAWLAWESFGELNGAPSFAEMRRRIERYRKLERPDPAGNYSIGCLMISNPVFLGRDQWIPQPADWRPNIVQGATYDLTRSEGARLLQECLAFRKTESERVGESLELFSSEQPRFGKGQIVRPRLGQGTFRVAVTDAYDRACSVTDEHSLPALEAAHIRPYAEGGDHDVRNGVLLRSDIHRLFDRGYVTVTPEHRLEVSRRLREDFENGRTYYPLHGKQVHVPNDAEERPDPRLLEWHATSVFLG